MTLAEQFTEDTTLRSHIQRKQHCCHGDFDSFSVIVGCFVVLTIAMTVALVVQINYGHPEVVPYGAVSSDDKQCSQVGVRVMKEGGNAVDAAVASLLCLSVVHPHVAGPGGSGVILIYDHRSKMSTVVDFMSNEPSNYQSQVLTNNDDGSNIGVPGFIRGLELAHRKYGLLPWATLFVPSVDIARSGFNVSQSLANALAQMNATRVEGVSPFEKTFFPRGLRLQQGAFFQRKKYADFLDDVAQRGSEGFYSLDYGVEMKKLLTKVGSSVSVHDLDFYAAQELHAMKTTFKNTTVLTASAPFGGTQLLLGLQLLQENSLSSATSAAKVYHSFIDAIMSSYATVVQLSSTGDLLPETNISSLAAQIKVGDNLLRLPEQPASAVSVMDTYDLYVAAVVGLGSYFGSRVMTEHGIIFNDHLRNVIAHVHTDDAPANAIHRVGTSYVPIVVLDAREVCKTRLVMATGEVGSAIQVTGQVVFRDLDMVQAIKEPRVTIRPGTDQILLDDFGNAERISGPVRNELKAMNHTLIAVQRAFAALNGVEKKRDRLNPRSDTSRGGGVAALLDSVLELTPV